LSPVEIIPLFVALRWQFWDRERDGRDKSTIKGLNKKNSYVKHTVGTGLFLLFILGRGGKKEPCFFLNFSGENDSFFYFRGHKLKFPEQDCLWPAVLWCLTLEERHFTDDKAKNYIFYIPA
jgi:hypothetical protein